MFVLDTNIVSELRPERLAPNAKIVAWLRRNGEQCSALLRSQKSPMASPGCASEAPPPGRRLGTWLDEVVSFHGEHILPVDASAALRASVLLTMAQAAGVEPDIEDAWIAASAELHNMTVLTLNDADFRPMGVAVQNPGEQLPPG
jgi:toxin FitB